VAPRDRIAQEPLAAPIERKPAEDVGHVRPLRLRPQDNLIHR
jgi:hypothetical protein